MRRYISLLLTALFLSASPLLRAQTPVWQVGSDAPDVEGYDELGMPHRLSDLRGKYVIFDVSAAWCYTSFELVGVVDAVKERLQEQGIDLVLYTVVYQDPVRTPFAFRSQALAWKNEFPSVDIVTAAHTTTDVLNIPLLQAARALLGSVAADQAFPTFAIIAPDGKVLQITQGLPSPDDLLAVFLPNQPLIGDVPAPQVGLVHKSARLSIHAGAKWGTQNAPFFNTSSSGFVVPTIQHGTLPHRIGLGISTEMAPEQEIWTLHYDTGAATSPNDHGIPPNQPIRFEIDAARWDGPRGVLTSGTAQVYLYDNVLSPSRVWTNVSYRNGKIEVGPLKAGSGFYPFRYIQVQFSLAKDDPHLLAVFGSDETARIIGLPEDQMQVLEEQWRGIEDTLTLTPHEPQLNLALQRIQTLWTKIRRTKAAGLTNSEKRLFLGMLTRMKTVIRNQKIELRRSHSI